jgi:elongation factor 1-alpha
MSEPSQVVAVPRFDDRRFMASDRKMLERRKIEATDSTGFEEITISVVGSVDAGKSTLVGTLVGGMLDDGAGLSRSIVFVHQHERDTGRTSSIAHQYMKDVESKRMITFVDLAGHETYLRTTMSGLSSSMPDYALICVSDVITKMTREHMSLLISMEIPFAVVFTKEDLVPTGVRSDIVLRVKRLLSTVKLTHYHVKSTTDIETVIRLGINKVVPLISVSCKSGNNLNLVMNMLRICKKITRKYPEGFTVDHIYNVPGHGIVFSGIAGCQIVRGDTLYLGPFSRGDFIPIVVRSIHNDYRWNQTSLAAGTRGCIAVNIRTKDRSGLILRRGMFAAKTVSTNVCREFFADVRILHHATSIKSGYQAYINIGMISESVYFVEIKELGMSESHLTPGAPLDILRAGEIARIRMRFARHLNFVSVGQTLAFREGALRGVGTVVGICPIDDGAASVAAASAASTVVSAPPR